MMNQFMAFYFRQGTVYACPICKGADKMSVPFEAEPVLKSGLTSAEIERLIIELLPKSNLALAGEFRNPKPLSPVVVAAKCRSYRSFYRGSAYARLARCKDHIEVARLVPADDGRGFTGIGDYLLHFPLDTPLSDIAPHIVEHLSNPAASYPP